MKTLVAASMLFGLTALGCTARSRASYQASEPHDLAPRPVAAVDVLLDAEPMRPFKVVGALSASSIESPSSIEMMRRAAAEAGLDGIYWIECTSPTSGRCSAKGFVYTTLVSQSGPDGSRTTSR